MVIENPDVDEARLSKKKACKPSGLQALALSDAAYST
jgi:hypothetical protein